MKNKKVIISITILLISICVLCTILAVWIGYEAFGSNRSIDKNSTEFNSLNEKVDFAKDYVKIHSEVDNISFKIFLRDNGFAPSSWDYIIFSQVSQDNLYKWKNHYQNSSDWKKVQVKLEEFSRTGSSYYLDPEVIDEIYSIDDLLESEYIVYHFAGQANNFAVVFENGFVYTRFYAF